MELIDLTELLIGFCLRFVVFFAVGFLFTMIIMMLSEFCAYQPKPESEQRSDDPIARMYGQRFQKIYDWLNSEKKIKPPLIPAFTLYMHPVNMFALMMALLFTVLSFG